MRLSKKHLSWLSECLSFLFYFFGLCSSVTLRCPSGMSGLALQTDLHPWLLPNPFCNYAAIPLSPAPIFPLLLSPFFKCLPPRIHTMKGFQISEHAEEPHDVDQQNQSSREIRLVFQNNFQASGLSGLPIIRQTFLWNPDQLQVPSSDCVRFANSQSPFSSAYLLLSSNSPVRDFSEFFCPFSPVQKS